MVGRSVSSLIFVALLSSPSFTALASEVCLYAGQTYTVGATVCECPSVTDAIVGGGTHKGGKIRIDRLECRPSGVVGSPAQWEKIDRPCFVGEGALASGLIEFYKEASEQFCSNPNNSSSGDILINMTSRSSSEDDLKNTRTDDQLSALIKQICKRYVKAPSFCSSLQ